MTKGGFVTGVIAGTVVGMGVSMMLNPLDAKDKKRLQKNTSQFFTTMGSVADRFIDMRR